MGGKDNWGKEAQKKGRELKDNYKAVCHPEMFLRLDVSNRLTLVSALLYKWYEEKAEIEHLCISDHLKAGIKCVSEFIICTYH